MPLTESSNRLQAALRLQRIVVCPAEESPRVFCAHPQEIPDLFLENHKGGTHPGQIHRLDRVGERSLSPSRLVWLGFRVLIMRRPEEAEIRAERRLEDTGINNPTPCRPTP